MKNEQPSFIFNVTIKTNDQILFSENVKSHSSKNAIANILRTRLRTDKLITEIRCVMSTAQAHEAAVNK